MRTVSGSLAMVLVGALAAILVTSSGAFTLPTLKPSNADTAFRQVPLLSPSGGTDYVTGVGHSTWPTFLDSSALVWPIGGGDSILIASTRTQGVTVGLNESSPFLVGFLRGSIV